MDSAFNKERGKNQNLLKDQHKELKSFLYSKKIKTDKFFTNNSGLYFDCGDRITENIIKFREKNTLIDSLNYRAIRDYSKFRGNISDKLYAQYRIFAKRVDNYQEDVMQTSNAIISSISLAKMWNTSILVAIMIGMISMSFIYRYLGEGANATEVAIKGASTEVVVEEKWTEESEEKYLAEMAGYLKSEADKEFEIRAKKMVKGYPIEAMLPHILEKDVKVAAFYIAIAKKESNWGKRVPVKDGKDCYNYLGYRGKRESMGTGGHTCFDSPKDAVDTISKRLAVLINDYERDTPAEMVVWKCGGSCAATGGQAAANKWIADVDMYLEKLNSKN